MSYAKFNKISIIGLGLIGGSIAKDAHEKKIAEQIIGYDRSEDELKLADKSGIFYHLSQTLNENLSGSDIVIICTPINSFSSGIIANILPFLKDSEIITDVCSVKRFIREQADKQLPEKFSKNFIPAHPIAGSEKSGFFAADSKLFDNKRTIITNDGIENQAAIDKIILFWKLLGCQIETMTAEKHDDIYAKVSHLPQLMSWAFAKCLEELNLKPQLDRNQQHIYNIFTRLAHSNRSIWLGIFEKNRDFIDQHIKSLIKYLKILIQEVSSDTDQLYKILLKSKERRISIPKVDFIPISVINEQSDIISIIIPTIIACALLNITTEEELTYVGTGYKDFTLPACQISHYFPELINNNINFIQIFLAKFIEDLEFKSLNS